MTRPTVPDRQSDPSHPASRSTRTLIDLSTPGSPTDGASRMTTDAPTDRSQRRSPDHRGRYLVAAGLLLLAPLVAVACGSDGNDASASKGGSSSSQGDFEAYRACLAKNGVNLQSAPQGQAGDGQQGTPPSIDQQAMQEAQAACADLQPQGGGFGAGDGGNGQAFQEYLSCLSENGVDTSKLPQGGQGGPGAAGGQAPSGQPPSGGSGQPPTGYGPPNGGQGGTPFGLDSSDPTVAKAMTACQSKLPSGGPGGQGASTTTTAATS